MRLELRKRRRRKKIIKKNVSGRILAASSSFQKLRASLSRAVLFFPSIIGLLLLDAGLTLLPQDALTLVFSPSAKTLVLTEAMFTGSRVWVDLVAV